MPEGRGQLVGGVQGGWFVEVKRGAEGFSEWADLQGLSEDLAADWLRLLPVAADFLLLCRLSQLLPLRPPPPQLMRHKRISSMLAC